MPAPPPTTSPSQPAPPPAAQFWQGFRDLGPVWLGAAPFGIAFAVTARASGFSVLETNLMSATVLAGASQMAGVGLYADGAGLAAIVLTTLLINARFALYGLSLARELPLPWPQRLLAAQLLTDQPYGFAMLRASQPPAERARAPLDFAYLLGAELSLYAAWMLATLAGSLAGDLLPPAEVLGVGIVFPLVFLGLLVPLARARRKAVVAALAGLGAWGLSQVLPNSAVILCVGMGAALLGAWWDKAAQKENMPGNSA